MNERGRHRHAILADLTGIPAAIPDGSIGPDGAFKLNLPTRSGGALFMEESAMVTTRVFAPTLDRAVAINRAFEAAFNTPASAHGWAPVMDVVEQADGYALNVELPGVKSSDVEITIEKNVLSIKGNKASPIAAETEKLARVHAAERVFGAFSRSLRLPEFVDGEHVEATFADGVLTVTVPKAKAAQPRRVEIR